MSGCKDSAINTVAIEIRHAIFLARIPDINKKMKSHSNYNLLELNGNYTGCETEVCLVVTPYVEVEFFKQLIKKAKPRKLIVVIDDGCRRDDLELIREAVESVGKRNAPKLVPVLASARGLVHLKLVYSEMRTAAGRRKRRLIFGSANATRQGFDGNINAEILCDSPLIAKHHPDIIGWCEDIVAKAISAQEEGTQARVEKVNGQLTSEIELRLPAFTLGRQRKHLSSFDLWIQRGRILAKFRPEPTFLKIAVPLKKGLGNSPLSTIAAEVGFASPETKALNFNYIGTNDDEDYDEDETGSAGPWRSQYFIWTNLGEWCSEECFQAKGREFITRGMEHRSQRLEKLNGLQDKDIKDHACKEFLTRLENLWQLFGEDASSYLQGDTQLDRTTYANLFEDRVNRDLGLLNDEGFRDRYLRGYEITELPRFQNDVRGWNTFIESIAKEICYQNRKKQPRSKLLKAIREAFGDRDDFPLEESSTLLAVLRREWEHLNTGSYSDDHTLGFITAYYDL